MLPVTSVIIVSYNVSELLRSCLNAVLAQGEPVEIIVIDNASTDNSVNMLRQEFPMVRLIINEKNLGFSAANNQGMKLATGKFIFLLNPDTGLKPDAIKILRDYFQDNSDKIVVGPKLLNADGTLQISAWRLPRAFAMIAEAFFLHRLLRVSSYSLNRFETSFYPGMLSGAALFFSRELFESIGGLDPNLFWMEDADFCKRVWKNGGKVVYLPKAEVIHYSGQSSKKNLKRVIANQLISKLKYYNKHIGTLVMMFASLFCLFHIISRLFLFGIAAPFSQRAAEKAGAYLFSLGRFFRYLFTGDQRVT